MGGGDGVLCAGEGGSANLSWSEVTTVCVCLCLNEHVGACWERVWMDG